MHIYIIHMYVHMYTYIYTYKYIHICIYVEHVYVYILYGLLQPPEFALQFVSRQMSQDSSTRCKHTSPDALVLSTSETSNEDNRIITHTHTHTHTHMGMPQKASNFNTVA